MFRNMVTSLMVHEQIKTTEARAKDLRRFAERVITMGKRAPSLTGLEGDALTQARADRVHAFRRVCRWVHDPTAVEKVLGEFAERYAERQGGYTRIVKTGRRPGDNAPMAIIQLVGAKKAAAVEPASEEDAEDEG